MSDGNGSDAAPGPRSRRVRLPAAERRETILRAAAAVFAEHGYRAARVSDVAGRVGVSEPVVFQNFGSKAALFAAVIERAAAEARHALDEVAGDTRPTLAALAHVLSGAEPGRPGAALVAGHAGTGHPGPGGHEGTGYGVLFADAATLAAEPELAGPALDAVRAVAGHLADLVRHVQAGGGAAADADPDAAAWLLLSMLASHRLRAAAMPPGLESGVAGLTLRALEP